MSKENQKDKNLVERIQVNLCFCNFYVFLPLGFTIFIFLCSLSNLFLVEVTDRYRET